MVSLGKLTGWPRGLLRARGRRRRRGLLRDARRGAGRVDRQRRRQARTRRHRHQRPAPRPARRPRSGHRGCAAIAGDRCHRLGRHPQPAQVRLGPARRRRPAPGRRDDGRPPSSGPLGGGLPRIGGVLDTARGGRHQTTRGGGVRRRGVRPPPQPRRRRPAALPRDPRQHHTRRRTLDRARRPAALRPPQDRLRALPRRAAPRDDPATRRRMEADRARQAGRRDQRCAPRRPARSKPAPKGDRRTHGGPRRVQPGRGTGRRARYPQGQGLRRRRPRHRTRAP